MANNILVKRLIHYYELDFEFLSTYEPDDDDLAIGLLRQLIDIANNKSDIRYQVFGEKAIFIQNIKIDPEKKLALGKLRCVRRDVLPEIMNTNTDETRELDAKEEEGLVETSHFIIDFSKKKKKVALEHNHFGAKIGDFISYLQIVGGLINAVRSVGYIPIVKDELSKMKERINRCSQFTVKVHKDNIEDIKEMDGKTYSALKAAQDQFKADYATLDLKFDYKERPSTDKVNSSIFNIIGKLIKDKTKTELFNTLTVKAEDKDKGNLLETFDLLIDKVKSHISVEKRPKHRTIISSDIFEKMKKEIIKKKI